MNPPECGVLERSWVRLLEIRGEDRQRFVNGQVTCEVKGLATGEGVPGFFTNIKGRIQADVTVLALEDRLWLELPAEAVTAVQQHLEKYILADRVEMEALSRVGLCLVGSGAPALLEGLGGGAPSQPHQHREITVQGRQVRVARGVDLGEGVAVYTLWTAEDAAPDLLAALREAGAEPLEPAAFDALRIAAGRPLFGRDFGPDTFPQETGREEAISYTKGCYLGQEVVARLHYRGQVSRQLRRLRLEAEEAGSAAAEEGEELLFEGRPAGTISSLAGPPYLEQTLALAVVQRRAFEPGTVLERASGGRAVVLTDD